LLESDLSETGESSDVIVRPFESARSACY